MFQIFSNIWTKSKNDRRKFILASAVVDVEMEVLKKIQMKMKSVGFGDFPDNMNPEDSNKYNTYEVEITYEGRTVKELYGNKWYDELQEEVGEVAKETMKIDILNHIISDCNVPEDFEFFKKKMNEFEMVNGLTLTLPIEELYEQSVEQQEKYLSLLGKQGIEQLRFDMINYRKEIPESASLIRFDTNWTEMFRDGETRVETEKNKHEIILQNLLNEFDIDVANLGLLSFNLPFIIIFYWSLKRAQSLGHGYIFIAGLFNDVVIGFPIGTSGLTYLLICGFAAYLRNITLRPNLINEWLFFLFTIMVVTALNYLMLI